MNNSSIFRMKWFVENYTTSIAKDKIKVLDVGSYDVNGSYKHLFAEGKFDYYGLDVEKGPNVDLILPSPYDWSGIETESYDIVISGQALEHIEFFWITLAEMTRVLKKDGLLCIIVPNGFGEHRYPVDCYRFFTDGMVALARYTKLEPMHAHTNCAPTMKDKNWYSHTMAHSMLVARKPYEGLTQHPDFKTYNSTPANQKMLRQDFIPYNSDRFIVKVFIYVTDLILNRLLCK